MDVTGQQPRAVVLMDSRDSFPSVLNQLGLLGEGVEVGVQHGLYSEHILRQWEGRLLYSVDPWVRFPPDQYLDIANVPQERQTDYYRETIRRLRSFGGRSKIIRLTSAEAVSLFADGSLDFCYLDANHRYEAVAADIAMWFPKVRPGGLLGGHDYIPDGLNACGLFGVQRAVHAFLESHGLELMVSGEEARRGGIAFRSWFVWRAGSVLDLPTGGICQLAVAQKGACLPENNP